MGKRLNVWTGEELFIRNKKYFLLRKEILK